MKALIGAAVPLFLSMVSGMVAHLVGSAVLGNRSAAALAALALALAVYNPVVAAVAGAVRGMVPFVAPHTGDPAAALPVLKDARWLAYGVGGLGAAVMTCVPLIATASGAPGEVVAELGALPWLLAACVVVLAAGGGANSVLIALGRSRQVLWSALAATAVEVALIVVLAPSLGVGGVGLAALGSAAAGMLVSNLALMRVPGLRGQSLRPGRPRPREIAELARVGLPLSATTLVKFGALAVVTYAAAGTGTRNAAAHALLGSLAGLLMVAALAVAQASVPEIARAADAARARRVNRGAVLLAVTASGVGAVGLLACGEPLMGLFTSDAGVRDTALALLPLLVPASVADGWQAVMGFGLTALKRSSWSLGCFLLGYGMLAGVAVPVAGFAGLPGLWTAVLVMNVVLVLLQGGGFSRHSARIGMVTAGA
ncbi:MATE family efflux transporter [Nonomuraea sp. NPDC003804]|uniref:MATE family efflux transporter n=1 Tax=Nonomuraea sp. NPDC003804 TaxID=3154547 RepID=UPI0033A24E2A